MAAPLIGLTTSIAPAEAAKGTPERATLNGAYVRALQEAGGVPVLLPPQLDEAALGALLERLGGLVLTGGGDIHPERYGEPPAGTNMATVSVERDSLEWRAASFALERGLPLLCICRGMQVLNALLGGSLVQDVASQCEGALPHRQAEPRGEATHDVRVASGSLLAAVTGRERFAVNSMHHQAIGRIGRGLEPVAWSDDGLVEGLELPGHPWALAVQWHPEELTLESPEARALFAGLVAASGR
jgi:putative glutamine amidotransferase